MKSLIGCSPLCVMPWLAALLPAQGRSFVRAEELPGTMERIYYDAAFGRAVGFERTSSTYTMVWTFDGVTWQRHLPHEVPVTTITNSVYDPQQRVGVLLGSAPVGWNPSRTLVGNGLDWRIVVSGSPFSSPDGGAAFAYDQAGGRVIAFGGATPGLGQEVDTTWSWSGGGWTRLNPANRPTARSDAAMALDPARSRVVLFGGRTLFPVPTLLDDTWEWNGVTWTQAQPVVIPPARMGTLAYDPGSQRVALLGGYGGTTGYLQDCWNWDGVQWTPRGALPTLSILGAWSDSSDLFVAEEFGYVNVWKANGAAWAPVFTDPRPTVDGVLTADPVRNEVVLAGAVPGSGTWRWNGDWQQVATSGPSPRRLSAMAPFGNGLLLCGGVDSTFGAIFDTWEWNGTSWTQRFPATYPGARYGHAIAAVGNQVLLFGGRGPQVYGDTWTYNGVDWTAVTTSNSPAARFDHGLAHDPVRGRTVLFGGRDWSFAFDDTWEWNGTNWQQAAPATVPVVSGGSSRLAYDPTRPGVVLVDFGVVAVWNGVDWSIDPYSGLGDYPTSVVFDNARQRLVVRDQNGAMNVYGPTPAAVELLGQDCGNRPDLRLGGRPALGTAPAVHVEGLAGAASFLVYGFAPASIPHAPGCDQLVTADAVLFGLLDARGMLSVPLPIPSTAGLRGVSLLVQSAVLDGGPVFGGSLSGALRVRVGD